MGSRKAKELKYDWRDVVAAMVPLREACMKRNLVLDTRLLYRYKPNSPTMLVDVLLNSVLLADGRQVAAYTSSLRMTHASLAFKPTADYLVASVAYLAIAIENDTLPLVE